MRWRSDVVDSDGLKDLGLVDFDGEERGRYRPILSWSRSGPSVGFVGCGDAAEEGEREERDEREEEDDGKKKNACITRAKKKFRDKDAWGSLESSFFECESNA